MIHKVKLPRLSVATETVMVVEWKCQVGDEVFSGDAILTVETDKVTTDVVSPVGGTIIEICVEPEQEIQIGDIICNIKA